MAESSQSSVPGFISYLLDPELDHDVYFLVGNKELAPPVKIGAVKKMLCAHSAVLRAELGHSKIAEKGLVLVIDIFPNTFTNLLKFVYGFDTTASLDFDDADNLLYAAEKYLMGPLKDKLALRLMSLLSYENICTLMNNPACYRHLELNSAITEILQRETDKVLASPLLMELSSDGFLKLLQQEQVKVPEIELWRAALRWAKNRTGSEEGQLLRRELTPHIKHIRFCAMNEVELCNDVVTTQVLSYSEFILVCTSVGLKQQQDELTEICNTIEPRSRSWSEPMEACVDVSGFIMGCWTNTSCILSTSDIELELIHLEFEFPDCKPQSVEIVQQGTDVSTPPIIIQDPDHVQQSDDCFQTHLVKDGENVRLLPKTRYCMTIRFAGIVNCYCRKEKLNVSNQHFTMEFATDGVKQYVCHFKKLVYKVRTVF